MVSPFLRSDQRSLKPKIDESEVYYGIQRNGILEDKTNLCSFVINIIIVAFVVIVILVLVPPFYCYFFSGAYESTDDQLCKITLVESIPEGLTYNGSTPGHLSTYEAWMSMLKNAKHSVDIASFYWLLRDDQQKTAWEGKNILKELLNVIKRGVKLRIIQNMPYPDFPNNDTKILKDAGAEVLNMDMKKFYGSGVLHTKFWLVDGEMLYLGSANTDWRSLTQVKELGALITSCKSIAHDAAKLVEVYVHVASVDKLPYMWPYKYWSRFNKKRPLNIKLNGTDSKVYFSSSPVEFCPCGRTSDIDAILDVIEKARSFINIAVMDYAPTISFQHPKRFWPLIDDALRKAAMERNITINFLGSFWCHTKKEMIVFLKSLAILKEINSSISVKMFCVPADSEQRLIPHSRVNHNKYMITDNAAYIGTSNWAGDYFTTTAGLSIVVNQTAHDGDQSFYKELLDVFMRDWTSEHSISIWDIPFNETLNC